jgi:hypothetical protein
VYILASNSFDKPEEEDGELERQMRDPSVCWEQQMSSAAVASIWIMGISVTTVIYPPGSWRAGQR